MLEKWRGSTPPHIPTLQRFGTVYFCHRRTDGFFVTAVKSPKISAEFDKIQITFCLLIGIQHSNFDAFDHMWNSDWQNADVVWVNFDFQRYEISGDLQSQPRSNQMMRLTTRQKYIISTRKVTNEYQPLGWAIIPNDDDGICYWQPNDRILVS